jgi:hypothetical protein
MALTDLDQSMGGLSVSDLNTTALDETTLNTSSVSDNVNDNVTNNLLVNSINQTTEQTTVRPKNVSAGNPMLRQMSGQPHFKDLNDFYVQTEKQLDQNPLYDTGAATSKWTPKKTVEKYDDQDYGYIYGIDNDDVYGKRESWYETIGKGIPRLAMGVINKVGEGAGFIAGLVNPWNWGEAIYNTATDQPGGNLIDIAADNAIYKTFENLDEWTKNEWLPTFQEAADRNKGFWARAGSDLDFWTDDFVDGVSFLAAAWIPGAVLGELGAGAAMASRLGKVAQGLGLAGEVGVAGIEEASALTRWFSQTGKAARNLDAFNSWAIATSSEAMFEASQVRNDILNSPDFDINGDPVINQATGKPFTTDEKKKMAGQGALNTFLMNAAVLGISNVFEYKQLLKLMGKAAPSAGMTGLVGGATSLGEEAVIAKAASPLWKTMAKQTVLGTAREGFYEENLQLAIQRYNTQYGQQGKIGGIFDADTWTKMLKQSSKQTVDAIYGKDNEAAISIGMGGIIGSLFGGITANYQEKKEAKHAQALMTAFNESQNSWLKFGDVFKYETVDAKDKEGNPIKTKKIVLDNNGNPVYDYDKIAAVATGMKLNAEMFDQSFNEVFKYNQNLLRTRAWADFVGAHINAGLESTLLSKLDKLENADPVSLAKLGFLKDQNFPAQLQKYRTIASEIINQNKALTDNVLFRNTSFFDKKNLVDNNRRAHLVEIIGNNVVNKEMVNEVNNDLQTLKSQLITDDQTHLTDGIVEQLNNSLYRIKSQEQLIEKMKKKGSDKILPMEVYERVLANLKADHAELIKDNDTQLKELTQNPDGTYRYKKIGRNEPALTNQVEARLRTVSELKNEILNDAQMFSFFADSANGRDNYTKFFNSVTAEKTKQAEERVEKERQKKASDEARAKQKAETEHKIVQQSDGTFIIIDPNGAIVEQGILSENEANLKATQLTAELVAKKVAEQKAKEEEEKRKQQQQNKNNTPTPLTLAQKKDAVKQKQDRAEELITKAIQDTRARYQQLIDEGKTPDEAEDILNADWLTTPDGKEYSKVIAEIEALENEIADEESGVGVPSLEEFLRDKFEKLKTNPDFKIASYEDWYKLGAANSYIRDYNKEYSKTEKIVPIPGTSTSTATTDEEAIGNLDLKDVTMATVQAALRAVRKVYQKVAGDQGLLQKLLDKVNEIKDDMAKNTILQAIRIKTTSSTYVPLSSVGIDVPISEHIIYDKINMTAEEFMLGFTLLGDKNILNTLSGATGSITDRVVAMATIKYIQMNQQKLDGANISNRTLITHETPKDIAKLNQGISVIAKASRADGFNLQLFLKDGSSENIYVGGIGNYAIVHPDNTTEKIIWSEEQREFVKDNMLINGEKMTDDQYNSLQEMYNKMQAFEQSVIPYLDEFLKTSPNEDTFDITKLFAETFTLSNQSFSAEKGELLEDVIARAGNDRLFTVMVMDENDNVSERALPLLAISRGTTWEFNFPLNQGERLVTMNDDNQPEPILDFKEYLSNEHGISPEMRSDFPGGYAWISKAENERGYNPYKLSRTKGTESPELFKEFITAFKDLKKAIDEGLASDKGVFKYEGKTYNTLNDLLVDFNKEHYGFYQNNGYVVNLSYNPKAKSNGKVVGKFLFEIRPQDIEQRRSLDGNQKKALNMYISTDFLMEVKDDMTNDEVTTIYQNWIGGLVKDYNKIVEKLRKSNDNTLKKIGETIDYHLLFSYDLKNNQKTFKLQLINKRPGSTAMPLFTYDASPIKSSNEVRLTFNDGAPTITQQRPPVLTPASAPVSTDAKADIEKEKSVITDSEFKELTRLAKFFLENPKEPTVAGSVVTRYPALFKAVTDIERRRQEELKKASVDNRIKPGVGNQVKVGQKFNEGSKVLVENIMPNESYDSNIHGDGYTVYSKIISDAEYDSNGKLSKAAKVETEIFPDKETADRVLQERYEKYSAKEKQGTAKSREINARYDAELAALEGGKPTSRTIVDDIDPDDNNAPFMLEETEENYEKYTESSFNQEVEWLRKALAGTGVKLEDLGTIINNLATKKQVLGYYKNKAIYVSETLSKKGTIYHEAFHALFRDVMTAKQRSFYIEKMKGKVGYITNTQVEDFRNDRGYFNKTDEEIRDLIYEEHLSDGFRKWKLEQKQPKESWFKKFISIFDRIINFFKAKKTDIEGLYEDFDAGRYANINREASTISEEGVFSLAYGRPKLFIKEGATNFTRDNTQVLNINLQNELVYKLTNIIATQSQGTFTEKFNNAVQQLKKDYNIEELIKNSADPGTFSNAIRARYGELFNDALFVLGESVPYSLSEELQGAADASSLRTPDGFNKTTLDVIKKAVQSKIETLGLEKGFDVDNLEIPEDDEDKAEKEKSGEFDTIHMNPLEGLSREFRSLFSTIPYQYVDEQLGVTINKMADGNMLYNAMIKIAANTPLDQILPSLAKAVQMMKEDNDRTSIQLEAFQNFIQKQFGIADLSDPEARPTKNIYLHKQFIDTFFVTELPSRQVVLKTTAQGSRADVFDASINADVNLKKDQIKYHYEQAYRRLATEEEKKEFEDKFKALQSFLRNDLLRNLKDPAVVNPRTQVLNKLVDKLKEMMDVDLPHFKAEESADE